MSYQKKTPYGQYVQVAGLGADDPWAEAGSGTVAPVTGGATTAANPFSSIASSFSSLFGSTPAPAKPAPAPSTTSQIGAGIGAFFKGLATPAVPAPVPGAMPM